MKRRFYLGVDVGATFTKIALIDTKGSMRAKDKISSQGFSNKRVFAQKLKESGKRLMERRGIRTSEIRGMGIGLPGPIDFDRGIVLNLTNIKGWHNFSLAHHLKQYFSFPVFIENDANCMALAESRKGAAKGSCFALCVTLGTGVGAGLILDGGIYRGPFYFGGEVGHIPVAVDGPCCRCGGKGCLEQYAGNRAILSEAKKIFGRTISLEEVSRLAHKGNAKAKKIWQEVGQHIGFAISGVVNVFNPEVVVIGGGVSQAGDVLLSAIRKTIRQHAMSLLKGVKVKKALLGNDAGVLGAALLAKEKLED